VRQRRLKLWAVGVPASALNLGEGGGERLARCEIPGDALTLGVEAKAAGSLAVGRYPVIGVLGSNPRNF
jgi:hypothetical protein